MILRFGMLGPSLLLAGCLCACSRDATNPSQDAASDNDSLEDAAPARPESSGEHPRLGAVMSEVGRRFELAGRAALANRFELSAYELGEIHELFAEDLPRAELPKEGPTGHIRAFAANFVKSDLPELEKAAAERDPTAFGKAFARVASACNQCHTASQKKFLEIPALPGRPVPNLDPLPAPAK